MLAALASRLPPRFVRAIGRAQFRSRVVARLVRLASSRLAGTGTIRHGAGAGLRFDATGGHPGYLLGTSEPEEQALLAAHLKPGGVLYDIGANVGFYSTIAARLVGPAGHVYAFEPHPGSAAHAERNARLNGFRNVTVVTAAVGDRDARLMLDVTGGAAAHRLDPRGALEVDVVALDRWVADERARPPTFVLVDVEGAELDVLAGMRALVAAHRPVICCEVHWLGESFVEYVDCELAPLGYALSRLGGGAPVTAAERWHALLLP